MMVRCRRGKKVLVLSLVIVVVDGGRSRRETMGVSVSISILRQVNANIFKQITNARTAGHLLTLNSPTTTPLSVSMSFTSSFHTAIAILIACTIRNSGIQHGITSAPATMRRLEESKVANEAFGSVQICARVTLRSTV